MILLIFLISLWGTPTWALDDCSTIDDISKDLGPVWNQARTDWCHVFTTTDCMTQHMLNIGKLKPGERLHPMRIAVAMAEGHSQSVANATHTNSTVVSDFNNISESTYFDNIPLCKESQLDGVKQPVNDLLTTKTPELSAADNAAWNKIFKANCHFPSYWINYQYQYAVQRVDALSEKNGSFKSNPALERMFAGKIDDALKHHELAAVGYDANFIIAHPSQKIASHWSSIVGRFKGPNGVCYYKVRNSWGPDCKDYSPLAHCKEGYLSVPADQFLKHVHTLQYLEDGTSPYSIKAPMPAVEESVRATETDATISH